MANEIDTETPMVGVVLLFNTCAAPHLAARLHSIDCEMVRMARKRFSPVSKIENPTQGDLDDLNERQFPVKRCKCLKS